MNTMFLAVLVIASLLFYTNVPDYTVQKNTTYNDTIEDITIAETDKALWEQNALKWLIEAQSQNGGWGAGSHAYQNVRDPHLVQTDPATTSFAAMALLKAGGQLKDNTYKAQILKALDRVLKDIDQRPSNGRITSLEGTQPQIKLGIHIDASMALQFLSAIREQLTDEEMQKQVDDAAEICIDLIQNSQDANGGWAGGGWAPVLQSAMANNALEFAQTRYKVDEKVMASSRKYQAENVGTDGVKSDDAAGVPLYAAASAQRATATEAKETESYMDEGMIKSYEDGKMKKEDIENYLVSKGIARDKALSLSNSYAVNQTSSRVLQSDEIWEGFGNNGGEEYLSYMLTSESLAQQNKEEWLKWKQSIEPKFKQSQNQNGSWSGHHCITSPVFCTAAIIQAWNAKA